MTPIGYDSNALICLVDMCTLYGPMDHLLKQFIFNITKVVLYFCNIAKIGKSEHQLVK